MWLSSKIHPKGQRQVCHSKWLINHDESWTEENITNIADIVVKIYFMAHFDTRLYFDINYYVAVSSITGRSTLSNTSLVRSCLVKFLHCVSMFHHSLSFMVLPGFSDASLKNEKHENGLNERPCRSLDWLLVVCRTNNPGISARGQSLNSQTTTGSERIGGIIRVLWC